jgi:hypothetical protein
LISSGLPVLAMYASAIAAAIVSRLSAFSRSCTELPPFGVYGAWIIISVLGGMMTSSPAIATSEAIDSAEPSTTITMRAGCRLSAL